MRESHDRQSDPERPPRAAMRANPSTLRCQARSRTKRIGRTMATAASTRRTRSVAHQAVAVHQMRDRGCQHLDARQNRIEGGGKGIAAPCHRRADHDDPVAHRLFCDPAVQDIAGADGANGAARAIEAERKGISARPCSIGHASELDSVSVEERGRVFRAMEAARSGNDGRSGRLSAAEEGYGAAHRMDRLRY